MAGVSAGLAASPAAFENHFVQHTIMGDHSTEAKYGVAFSQPHAIDVADIDGDGLTDIVVGKGPTKYSPALIRTVSPG